jgi:hypothetical protein
MSGVFERLLYSDVGLLFLLCLKLKDEKYGQKTNKYFAHAYECTSIDTKIVEWSCM